MPRAGGRAGTVARGRSREPQRASVGHNGGATDLVPYVEGWPHPHGRGGEPAARQPGAPRRRSAPTPMPGRVPSRAPPRPRHRKPKPRVASRPLASPDPRPSRDDRRLLARTSPAIRFPAPPPLVGELALPSQCLVIAVPILRPKAASVQERSIPGASTLFGSPSGFLPTLGHRRSCTAAQSGLRTGTVDSRRLHRFHLVLGRIGDGRGTVTPPVTPTSVTR
jgi:hypothetical protein